MDNNIFSYKEELRLNSNKKLLGHWDKMKRKLQMFVEVINQERKKMVILNINEETKIIPKTTSENLEMKNQIQKPDERLDDYLKNINELLAKDPNLKPTSYWNGKSWVIYVDYEVIQKNEANPPNITSREKKLTQNLPSSTKKPSNKPPIIIHWKKGIHY